MVSPSTRYETSPLTASPAQLTFNPTPAQTRNRRVCFSYEQPVEMFDKAEEPSMASWWEQNPSKPIAPLSHLGHERSHPPHTHYRSSFDSTISLPSTMDSSSASDSASLTSPSSSDFGHSMLSQADAALIRQSSLDSQYSHISIVPDSEHSPCANVEAQALNVRRPSTPISIATTFGGAPRMDGRSRTVTGENSSAQAVPISIRSTRSGSLESELSHCPTTPDLLESLNELAASPCNEEDDPLEVGEWPNAHNAAALERAAEKEIRSTPGVMGVGEGWAGGRVLKKKRGGWFSRRSQREATTEVTEDPLALWTVPEAPRAGPLKSAWNRSVAKFGASVAVLSTSGAEDKSKKVDGRRLSERAKSVFSNSRVDLRGVQKRGSESMSDLVMSTKWLPRTPPYHPSERLPTVTERFSEKHLPSQPHSTLPRSTSLSLPAVPSRRAKSNGPVLSSFPTHTTDSHRATTVPLAPEADDILPVAHEAVFPPRSRSTYIRARLGRFAGHRSSLNLNSNETLEKSAPAPEGKRKSFSISTLNLSRWSRSETNLLDSKPVVEAEPLDDLIARLKEVKLPVGAGGDVRDSRRGSRESAKTGQVSSSLYSIPEFLPPIRPHLTLFTFDPFSPGLNDPFTPSYSGSSTTTTPSPVLVTPPEYDTMDDVILEPKVAANSPRRPSHDFAWAAQK